MYAHLLYSTIKNNFIGAGFILGARDLKNSGKNGLNCRWALSLVIFTMFIKYDRLSWKIKKGKKFKILLEIMHESLKKLLGFFLNFQNLIKVGPQSWSWYSRVKGGQIGSAPQMYHWVSCLVVVLLTSNNYLTACLLPARSFRVVYELPELSHQCLDRCLCKLMHRSDNIQYTYP